MYCCHWLLLTIKIWHQSKNSCIKRIHLVTDDGLYDRKALHKLKSCFYLLLINNGEFTTQIHKFVTVFQSNTLRKKCPCLEIFWFLFSAFGPEYGVYYTPNTENFHFKSGIIRTRKFQIHKVHEMIPFSGSLRETKYNMDFQQPQGVYFLEKYDELSQSVAFRQKLRNFTEWTKGREPHENKFWVFLNTKMNVTNS